MSGLRRAALCVSVALLWSAGGRRLPVSSDGGAEGAGDDGWLRDDASGATEESAGDSGWWPEGLLETVTSSAAAGPPGSALGDSSAEARRNSAERRSPTSLRRPSTELPPDVVHHILDLTPLRYQVASCSHGCATMTLWGSDGPRHELLGHGGEIIGVRFFPLGDRVLTWSSDKTAIIWDARTGDALHILEHEAGVVCGRVFPAGDRIATCSRDGACAVWNASSGEAESILSENWAKRVEIFPNGSRLLTWGLDVASLWDRRGRRLLCELRGHTMSINDAKIFPDGNKVATIGEDCHMVIWRVADCQALHDIYVEGCSAGLVVLKAGRGIATMSSNGSSIVWDEDSGAQLRQMVPGGARWPPEFAWGMAGIPDTNWLVTFNTGGAIIWDTATGRVLQRLIAGFPSWMVAIAPAPGGDVLATCGSGRVTVWSVLIGIRLNVPEGPPELGSRRRRTDDGVRRPGCLVAVGLGGALDPRGFGTGLSWRSAARLVQSGLL